MNITEKIQFHFLRLTRMLWFYIKYKIKPWKKINDIYIPVRPSMGYSVLRFIDNGQYESGEITIVKNTLTSEDRVLELGTGLGFISAYCSKRIGDNKVFTFEANPGMAALIKQLYLRNNVLPAVTYAILGRERGLNKFYVSDNGFFSSSQIPLKNAKEIKVEVLPLNEVIQTIKPTYFIMDIEGGEYEIFSFIDFQTIRKIQFELHPDLLDNEKVKEIFSILVKNDFKRDDRFESLNNYYFSR